VKVYSITGTRPDLEPAPNGSRQSREIGAFKSISAFLEATGYPRSVWNWSGGMTGNASEVELATATPGVVYYRHIDGRNSPWRMLERENVRPEEGR
jgi:hypothetical protein